MYAQQRARPAMPPLHARRQSREGRRALDVGGARAGHRRGLSGQIQAAVHIQLELTVGVHVRPEQREQRQPDRVGEAVGPLRIGENCCISSVLT